MTKESSPAHSAELLRSQFQLPQVPRPRELMAVARDLGAKIGTHSQDSGILGRLALSESGDSLFDSQDPELARCAQWTISIEQGLPVPRLRFTLAHEIGHLVLRLQAATPKNEERWCNQFAAELLMPQAELLHEFRASSPSLEIVQALSQSRRVTLEAAMVRLNHLFNWTYSLLTFEFIRDEWRVSAMVSPSRVLMYQLKLDPSAASVLQDKKNGIEWLPFVFQCERLDIKCEFYAVRKHRIKAYFNHHPVDTMCTQILGETKDRRRAVVTRSPASTYRVRR